eukprot:353680-Pelagomonas_calceolata.AAC.1
MSECLLRFHFYWVYKPGGGNLAAGALSHNPAHKAYRFVAAAMLMMLTGRKSRPSKVTLHTEQWNPDEFPSELYPNYYRRTRRCKSMTQQLHNEKILQADMRLSSRSDD